MRIIIYFLTILCLSANFALASQRSEVKDGNELFKRQEWDAAVDHYLNALEHKEHADIVQYDLGTAFYKQGNYDQAIEHLKKAVSQKNKDFTYKTYYNLGNSFYQKSKGLEEKDLDAAIQNMQEASMNYAKALSLNPKDKDVGYNQDAADKKLEELKKKLAEKKKNQRVDSNKYKEDKDSENKLKEDKNSKNEIIKEDPKSKNKVVDQDQHEQKQDVLDQDKQEQAQQQQQNQAQEKKEAGKSQEQASSSEPANQEEAKQAQAEEAKAKKQAAVKKQAKELLAEYERDDAPKGLLNFSKRHQGESHVDKDW